MTPEEMHESSERLEDAIEKFEFGKTDPLATVVLRSRAAGWRMTAEICERLDQVATELRENRMATERMSRESTRGPGWS